MIQVIQIMIIVIKPGQKLEDKQVEALAALPSDASFLQKLLVKHRRLIGVASSLSNILQKMLFKRWWLIGDIIKITPSSKSFKDNNDVKE